MQEKLSKNTSKNVYGNLVWVSIANYKYGSLLLSLNIMGSLRVDREPGRMLPYWPLLLAKPSWLLQKCVHCGC